MNDYMLTVLSGSNEATDVQVNGAGSILEAMQLAESITSCRVNHGRGGIGSLFDPAIVIDAESGEVTRRHNRTARIEIAMGPPEVMRAIQQAMAVKPKAAPKRKTGGHVSA